MLTLSHPRHPPRRQQGAVIITVALVMLFLLGFVGVALDFGRLFVIKSELQTAMDGCALAGAQELDGQPDSINRAQSAGLTAGNLNGVDFQSANWGNLGQIQMAEISFRDASWAPTIVPASAKYVQCQHTHTGAPLWLMQALGAFSGNTAQFPNAQNVGALAVATRGNAQTTCPVPVALKPKAGGIAPNYGFAAGEWVTLIMAQNAAAGGEIGWANLDGSNSASETEAEMNGFCGTRVGDTLGTPGVQASVADAWNRRFGIYKNPMPDIAASPGYVKPDFTGYAYSTTNWPIGRNAYDGTPDGMPGPGNPPNFVQQRVAFAACSPSGRVRGANSCESISGASLNSFGNLAASGTGTNSHGANGTNRRIVTVPVINNLSRVVDYACMLMLQPLNIPMDDVQLEFIGNAANPASPCATAGLPGGVAGPLVPVLVR